MALLVLCLGSMLVRKTQCAVCSAGVISWQGKSLWYFQERGGGTPVHLGGDTDTTACVTGGLAGIAYGWQGIPGDRLESLARKEDIMGLCNRLGMF